MLCDIFIKILQFFQRFFLGYRSIFIQDNCNNSRRSKKKALLEAKKDTFIEGEGYLINI